MQLFVRNCFSTQFTIIKLIKRRTVCFLSSQCFRTGKCHCALSLNKDSSFLILPITLAPLVQFGWNLKWPTFSIHRWWWLDFQGQKGHIKARWVTFWPLIDDFDMMKETNITICWFVVLVHAQSNGHYRNMLCTLQTGTKN